MHKRPPELIYGVDDEPPFLTNLILGLQHVFLLSVCLIFPVLIVRSVGGTPQEAEFMVSMSMLAAGIGTMLQALNRRGVGSGYLCPSLCGPSYLSASILAASTGGLPLLFGMTSVAGLFEVLLSRILYRLRSLFPPEVVGVIVTMVGITLIPVLIPNFFGQKTGTGDVITESSDIIVSLITLVTIFSISVWSKGRMKLYPVLIGMVVGYAAAAALGLLNASHIELFREASLVAFPDRSHFSWSLDIALLFPFAIAATCSTLKTVGDITTCQKINDIDWKRTDMKNASQGILADGLSAIFSGLVGAMAQSTSSSNVGLSIGTGATSRKIAFAIGGLLVFLAFLPKLAMIFVIMPGSIMGATLIYSVSFMIVAGFQIITSRMLDARRTLVVGIPIIFGISVDIFPHLYENVPHVIKPVFSSDLAFAAVLVVLINFISRIGIAKQKRMVLRPGIDDVDSIFEFMEKQGAAWGARREVIYKAVSAIYELFESITTSKLSKGDIEVDVSFDEFNLDVEVRYRGEPPELPSMRPEEEDLLMDEAAVRRLSGFIVKGYANSVKLDGKDDVCRVRLHFDH